MEQVETFEWEQGEIRRSWNNEGPGGSIFPPPFAVGSRSLIMGTCGGNIGQGKHGLLKVGAVVSLRERARLNSSPWPSQIGEALKYVKTKYRDSCVVIVTS